MKKLGIIVAALALHLSHPAHAEEAGSKTDEASTHYRRGMSFFQDKSFSAALVEFRRAYEIAPKPLVLYNIAQIQLATQDYASALQTFEKYLRDGGNSIADERRTEVQAAITRLHDKVAYLTASTDAPDGDIAIDDAVVAHVPLQEPLVVDAGRRHVTLLRNGHEIAARWVELAAGDHAQLSLNLPLNQPQVPAPNQGTEASTRTSTRGSGRPTAVLWATWGAAGALGAGTAVTGALALGAASKLADDRHADGVTRSTLDAAQTNTKTLALVTDILGAATIVAVGVATWASLSGGSHEASPKGSLRLQVAPNAAFLTGQF